ncbi:MAG: protein kinase domain-containing protein, partial [Solirubrobacterales bacterium]
MGEDVDERSDVYSLGVVLYEMLSGDVPFQAETQVGVAMKHVNEPIPDIKARRPEVSAAVAAAVDRATAKDPRDRYGSVAEMVRDLEATLEVEAARRGGTSGEATSVLDSVPRSQRRLAGRRVSGAGIAMGLVGVALIAAALVFGGRELNNFGDDGNGGASEIKLPSDGASEFDPDGDGKETESQNLAIDGNPTGTSWETEHYVTEDFGGFKDGVGLAIDAGDTVTAKSIEVRSPVSGWDAQIYLTERAPPDDLSGWGPPVATISDGATKQTVNLTGEAAESFLIWITKPVRDETGEFKMEISDIRLLS